MHRWWGVLAVVLASACAVWAQAPYVGYVYPAGGQQGTTVTVTAAGQRLRGATVIAGPGMRATVTRYVPAGGPLNLLQQEELRRRLKLISEARSAQRAGRPAPAPPPPPEKPVALPDLPELRNLEQKTQPELRLIADKFLNPNTRPKPPLAEVATLEVTIDADTAPGNRELRLLTQAGLSNPMVFQVGRLPEVRELNQDEVELGVAPPGPAPTPVLFNGQILPGEVDRRPVSLHAGQSVVIAVQARRLIPYLADGVPGWFQAVVAVHNAQGRELAYADDNGFDPDPVLHFTAPADGVYQVVIRDAIYRGRQDFVYRIAVGEAADLQPLVSAEPSWTVPVSAPARPSMNPLVGYLQAAGPVAQRAEAEPNDAWAEATVATLPQLVSGSIARTGDVDTYRFAGKAGQTIVAEVYARRLGSPLDALLRLTDATGAVLALNDDTEDRGMGLMTHHADAYLSARLPADGEYAIQVSDAQRHGGQAFGYFLRMGPPQPDFALRVTPSGVGLKAGEHTVITAIALRRDGWAGDIEVSLKDAPAGYRLSGGRIPAGRDAVRMTLTAPATRRGADPVTTLAFEGRATINGVPVVRQAVPADDVMQAFAYRHLVPAQAFLAATRSAWRATEIALTDPGPVRIPAGGQTTVQVTIRPMPVGALKLELSDPPAGLTLADVKTGPEGATLVLKAEARLAGYADNLIVDIVTETEVKTPAGATRKVRTALGVLPAIPFIVTQP